VFDVELRRRSAQAEVDNDKGVLMIAYFLGRPAHVWARRSTTTTSCPGMALDAPLHQGSQGRLLQTAVGGPSPVAPAGWSRGASPGGPPAGGEGC